MNGKKVSPAAIVIVAAGAVALIASFLAFYKYSYGGAPAALSQAEINAARAAGITLPGSLGGGSTSYSAWSNNGFLLFPLAILPALFGVIMALQVGLTNFANVKLPDRVLGFDWTQIHLLLAIQSALLMLCYLLVDKSGLSYGVGFWLMLVASIGLVVGAVMLAREPATATGPAPAT
jgi:hypothetical protein